jgi:hypothetical protein
MSSESRVMTIDAVERLSFEAARRLSYCIKFLTGLATGLYILTYLADLGRAAAPGLGLSAGVIGLTALAFCFILEYFLEVPSGAEAQVSGTKPTFIISFMLRGVFPLIVLLTQSGLLGGSPVPVIVAITLAMAVFAVAYTLFTGNFDQWLISHCQHDAAGRKAFALSDTFFYTGLILGSAVAVVIPRPPAYIASASCCFLAALVCLTIPSDSNAWGVRRLGGRIEAMRQATADLARLPLLNRTFWVGAMAYGLVQVIDALLPMTFILGSAGISTKLVILAVCLWAPSLIGALTLVVLRKRGVTSPKVTLGGLRLATLAFCGCGCLLPLAAVVPPSVSVWMVGGVIFATRFAQGRFFPQLQTFNALLANGESSVAKVLLSIGERRKKIGAVVSLAVPIVGGMLHAIDLTALCVVIGLLALLLGGYSFSTLKGD